jgi:hypothetical protein
VAASGYFDFVFRDILGSHQLEGSLADQLLVHAGRPEYEIAAHAAFPHYAHHQNGTIDTSRDIGEIAWISKLRCNILTAFTLEKLGKHVVSCESPNFFPGKGCTNVEAKPKIVDQAFLVF